MAENKDAIKPPLPPYTSFKTFYGFIQKLKETTVPDQIDSSILRSYSGSVGRQIVSTLKYLKLIEPSGKTSDRLTSLVKALDDSNQWEREISDLIFDVYNPILGDLNLDTATARQLQDKFRTAGAEGEVLQKCIAFFTSAVASAGLTLSPHITDRPRRVSNGRAKNTKAAKQVKKPQSIDGKDEEAHIDLPHHSSAGSVKFSLPIPGKGSATIFIPADLLVDDWEMINVMMRAYISRLQKAAE